MERIPQCGICQILAKLKNEKLFKGIGDRTKTKKPTIGFACPFLKWRAEGKFLKSS
jgi:hypothetical protein